MERLKLVYEAKGYTGRSFARSIGMTAPDLCRVVKGHVNLTPQKFRMAAEQLDVAPEALILPHEASYLPGNGNTLTKPKRPENRTFNARLQTRVDEQTAHAFRTICQEEGKTVSEKLAELVKDEIIKHEPEHMNGFYDAISRLRKSILEGA